MADDQEVEVLDPEAEAREKAQFDQALASLDGRTQQVVRNLAEVPLEPEPEGAAAEGASVGIVAGIRQIVPQPSDPGPGREMRVALLSAGITPTRLAGALEEGLRAAKTVLVAGRLRRVPDFAVRLKYLELAHKLRGDVAAAADGASGPVSYEERVMALAARLADRSGA